MRLLGNILLTITLLWSCLLHAQTAIKDSLNKYLSPTFYTIDPSLATKYPFINFDNNSFHFYTPSSKNWEKLYSDITKMVKNKDRKLNFYHIGGSHLQADIYTNDIRTHLQTKWNGLPGERGLVYPYDLAHTNNPANYEFSSPNTWRSHKSVGADKNSGLQFGLMGAYVECSESVITVRFRYDKTEVKPGFTRIRIYHNKGYFPFDLDFGSHEIMLINKFHNETLGYTEAIFTDPIDTFNVIFTKKNSDFYNLQLHAVQLANTNPGVSYTTIGVNGAGLYTYLNNVNFEEQLKESPPDFFAFSVGTNDANVPYDHFNPATYKYNLEQMMLKVLRANPNCAILLTVPNDAGYHKRLNKNVAREREVIIELAQQYSCAVWDFYGTMGELGSSRLWLRNGLMQSDLVHFTGPGYHLKGDLFIDAWAKWEDQMGKRRK